MEKTDENARHISGENVVSSVKLVNENLLFFGGKKKNGQKIGTRGAAGYPNELVT